MMTEYRSSFAGNEIPDNFSHSKRNKRAELFGKSISVATFLWVTSSWGTVSVLPSVLSCCAIAVHLGPLSSYCISRRWGLSGRKFFTCTNTTTSRVVSLNPSAPNGRWKYCCHSEEIYHPLCVLITDHKGLDSGSCGKLPTLGSWVGR